MHAPKKHVRTKLNPYSRHARELATQAVLAELVCRIVIGIKKTSLNTPRGNKAPYAIGFRVNWKGERIVRQLIQVFCDKAIANAFENANISTNPTPSPWQIGVRSNGVK